jgi:Ni,Fe-hydrogenase III small subunit/ferredoxin-like protein FixX
LFKHILYKLYFIDTHKYSTFTFSNNKKMFFQELHILRRHGVQFVKAVTKVELHELFRGRPVIETDIANNELNALIQLCPADAIGSNPASIDIGKCLFCNECHFALPDKIKFTNDYKIASNIRENLIVKAGQGKLTLTPEFVRSEIRLLFGNALKLRQVSAGGDNSAEMELNASGNVNFDMGRWGIEFVASPRHADGLVVTGPITENMAEALQIAYDAVPSPKILILVGTDAISGGLFRKSIAVNREFLSKYTVDLYVPGNPPHPLTFINGILEMIGKKKRG